VEESQSDAAAPGSATPQKQARKKVLIRIWRSPVFRGTTILLPS
jgi:hypothetical protein